MLVDGPVAHVSESIRTLGFFRRKTGGVPSTLLIKCRGVRKMLTHRQNHPVFVWTACQQRLTVHRYKYLYSIYPFWGACIFPSIFLWLLDLALLNCEVWLTMAQCLAVRWTKNAMCPSRKRCMCSACTYLFNVSASMIIRMMMRLVHVL